MKLYVFILTLSVFLMSCSNSKESASEKLMYNIITGEGGGFTGLQEGLFIDSSGAVYSFSGRNFDSAVKNEKGILSSESFTEINAMVQKIDTIKSRISANIYKFIILKRGGSPDINLSWNDVSPHTPALDEFYNKIKELTEKLNK